MTILIESCPVVLDIRILHHYRQKHLRTVLSHLGIACLRIILSIECSGVMRLHLIYIHSYVACKRTADNARLGNGNRSDELRIKTLAWRMSHCRNC